MSEAEQLRLQREKSKECIQDGMQFKNHNTQFDECVCYCISPPPTHTHTHTQSESIIFPQLLKQFLLKSEAAIESQRDD